MIFFLCYFAIAIAISIFIGITITIATKPNQTQFSFRFKFHIRKSVWKSERTSYTHVNKWKKCIPLQNAIDKRFNCSFNHSKFPSKHISNWQPQLIWRSLSIILEIISRNKLNKTLVTGNRYVGLRVRTYVISMR